MRALQLPVTCQAASLQASPLPSKPKTRQPPRSVFVPPTPVCDDAWSQAQQACITHAVQTPITVVGSNTRIHLLGVQHDRAINPYLISEVAKAVKPDALAIEQPPERVEGFFLLAPPLQTTIQKMTTAAPTSIADVHCCLSEQEKDDAMNNWLNARVCFLDELVEKRFFLFGDLYYSEFLAAAHIAADIGIPLHGIDLPRYSAGREYVGELHDKAASRKIRAAVWELAEELNHPVVTTAYSSWRSSLLGRYPDIPQDMLDFLTRSLLYECLSPAERAVVHKQLLQRGAVSQEWHDRVSTSRDVYMSIELINMAHGVRVVGSGKESCILAIVGESHLPGMRKILLGSRHAESMVPMDSQPL